MCMCVVPAFIRRCINHSSPVSLVHWNLAFVQWCVQRTELHCMWSMCRRVHACMHACVCVCVFVCACMYMCVLCVNVSVRVCVCMYVYVGLARTVYIHRIFGDFPAKNTVHTPYIYGSGQPHVYVCLCVFVCACMYMCVCVVLTCMHKFVCV